MNVTYNDVEPEPDRIMTVESSDTILFGRINESKSDSTIPFERYNDGGYEVETVF